MQTRVIFYRKLPNPEVHVYHTVLKPETVGFQRNTMRICPHNWYQLAKFWLLADRLIHTKASRS